MLNIFGEKKEIAKTTKKNKLQKLTKFEKNKNVTKNVTKK